MFTLKDEIPDHTLIMIIIVVPIITLLFIVVSSKILSALFISTPQ